MTRKEILVSFCICLLALYSHAAAAGDGDTTAVRVGDRVQLSENLGQWDSPVWFAAQMHGGAAFLERDGILLVVQESPNGLGNTPSSTSKTLNSQFSILNSRFHHQRGHRYHAYRMRFSGANSGCTPQGRERTDDYENYYIGRDRTRWATHVRRYNRVDYPNLYDNITLKVYGAEHALKYDLVVHPGGNPGDIHIQYEGAEGLRISNGRLVVKTSVNEVVEHRPYAYQVIKGDTVTVDARYRLKGSQVTFVVGDYDTSEPLVIDPTLVFSTYTGSGADNWGTTATYDSYKNTYTAGLVFNIGYPVSVGAYSDNFSGNADIGIFKFDTTGSQRLFATYLGGTYADMPHSMYVNTFDELLIFGTTGSTDFPTSPDALDTSFNGGTELAYLCFYNSEYYRNIYYPDGSDIFVSHFSSDGSALLASTYVGGSGNDGLNYRARYNDNPVTIMQGNDSLYHNYGDGARGEIITDNLNNVYIGSTTFSYNFPTTANAWQCVSGGQQEGVLLKLDHNLRNLLWSTYVGGFEDDAIYSIDCDDAYNVVACGGTNSAGLPFPSGGVQPTFGGGSADGMVVKISAGGDSLLGATYYGSPAYDQCYFVRCGKHNDIFLYGQTQAEGSTMVYNATYNTPGAGMLLARLSDDLQSRVWSTVFGTPNETPNLSPTAFAADICDRVYAVGWGRDFVGYNGVQWNTAGTWNMATTGDAYQSNTDGQDFYIICVDNTASQLEYATFFGELHIENSDGGGDHVDGGTSRIDRLATLYQSVCASCGGHDAFPTTPGVWSQHNNSSNCNNALFRFNIHDDFPVAEFVTPPAACAPYTVHFHNTGRGESFTWTFGDGGSATIANPIHTFTDPGEYTVQLVATKADGCKTSDTATAIVKVIGNTPTSHRYDVCDGDRIQIGTTPLPGCMYRWRGGTVSDSTIANPYVTASGTYLLEVRTAGAPCAEVDTFRVLFRHLIDTVLVTPPTCPGGHDGSATAVTSGGGSTTYTYTWDGTATSSAQYGGLSDDGATHTLHVTDGVCESSYSFTIAPLPRPIIRHTYTRQICEDCTGEIAVTVDGSGDYSGLWDDGATGMQRDSLCAGSYGVTISDTNGCTYRDSATIQLVTLADSLRAWADDTVLFVGNQTRLHVTEAAGATYLWMPGEGLDNPMATNPVASPSADITYSVTRSDTTGCQYTARVTLHCSAIDCGESLLFIPNTFTPNDDGYNDRLCFRSENISAFHIAIFSRWGEKVYESYDPSDCWDGRYHGNPCLPGVYYYTCHIRCANNQENDLKGDVTLIR